MNKHKIWPLLLVLSACQHSEQPQINSDQALLHSKPMRGDYWADRYTYPTHQFDPAWFSQARVQHDLNIARTPQGRFARNGRADIRGLPVGGFTSLGPKPLNAGSSRFSGRVNVIVTDPLNDQVAYIGVDGGGVWKTENCCSAATGWDNVTDHTSINGAAIGDLHLDPNDSDIIYAGTGDLRYGSYSFGSSGLLRSKDAGQTWTVLGEDVFSPVRDQPPGEFPQYQAIGRVRTNPLNSTHIAVGTKTGVFFSYDDGANWTGPCQTNAHTSQRQDVTGMEVDPSGNLYASIGTRGHNTTVQPDLDQNGANGVYKTAFPTSGCPVWTLVSTPLNGWPAGTGGGVPFPTNSLGRIDLAMSPSDPDVLYAQVANISNRSVLGVWRTGDGGASWTQTASSGNIGGCDDSGSQAWYDMGMSVSPTDPDVLFLSAVDVFRSDNGGNTFTNSTCGYAGGTLSGDFVHVDHHARAYVNNDPARLLIGSDGGVWYTDNADAANPRNISFTQLNDSVVTIEFYSGDLSGDFANTQTKFAAAGAQDNGSSVALWDTNVEDVGPVAWTRVNGGDGIFARIEPLNGQRVYVESQNGNMRVSASGPLGSYNNFVSPWSGDNRVPFVFPFEINKYNCTGGSCDQLIAGTYRVWETVNGGLSNGSWYVNSPDLTKNALGNRSIINQLHFSLVDASIAMVGTNDGNVQIGFNMGAGTANSANWVDLTDGNAVLPNRPILDVVGDAVEATTVYAAVGGFDQNTPTTPGHVFQAVCDDAACGSFTWFDKSGNLPNIPVDSVMVNPNVPGMVFAGTDWGLYYTNDIEVSEPLWYRFSAGLPSVMIWDMAIDRGATTLAVFTRSRGAYVWPLPTEIIDNNTIFANGFDFDFDLIFEDDFEDPL